MAGTWLHGAGLEAGGTGMISTPRGLSICVEGPLNHEAEALQLLFAEPSAQCRAGWHLLLH